MISADIKKQIIAFWDKYIADNKKVRDTKGNVLENIFPPLVFHPRRGSCLHEPH